MKVWVLADASGELGENYCGYYNLRVCFEAAVKFRTEAEAVEFKNKHRLLDHQPMPIGVSDEKYRKIAEMEEWG